MGLGSDEDNELERSGESALVVFGGGRTEKRDEEDVDLGLSEIPICNSSSSCKDAAELGEVFERDFGGGSERKGDEEVDFGGGRDEKAPVGFEELERCTC